MRHKLFWLTVAGVLLLSGCTQMDQRSDLPEKKTLKAIEAPLTLTQAWRIDTGIGSDNKDIKLLLGHDRHRLYTVDARGDVLALDAKTGKTIWKSVIKGSISAGPVVADNRLVVGTNDGKVIAVDTQTGKVLWISTTTSEILASPTIADNIVFVHTMDGGLSALSLLDGRQLWRFTHNLPPLMLRRSSAPVVSDDLVIAGFSNGKLMAMQKSDGAIVWSQDISHPKGVTDLARMVDISADPVVAGNHVYAASYQGNVAALTRLNGHVLWERAIPSFAGLAVSGDLLFVSASNGDVVALDTQNGGTYWLQTQLQGRILSKPAVFGKYLIVGDEDGNIHWLDKNTGKMVGRFELDKDGIEATPVVMDNKAYVLGCGGELVALAVD